MRSQAEIEPAPLEEVIQAGPLKWEAWRQTVDDRCQRAQRRPVFLLSGFTGAHINRLAIQELLGYPPDVVIAAENDSSIRPILAAKFGFSLQADEVAVGPD